MQALLLTVKIPPTLASPVAVNADVTAAVIGQCVVKMEKSS